MRLLIYVPLLHPPEMMRGMTDVIGKTSSETSATHVEGRSNEFWDIVRKRLATFDVKTPRFYLESYTDGKFPVEPNSTKFPLEIRSPDEQIIAEFIKRVGGTVEHTEDRGLLEETFQSYRLAGEAVGAFFKYFGEHGLKDRLEIERLGRIIQTHTDHITELHNKRDDYMRQRIIESLQDGEVGFLFVGGKHDVTSKLPPDIQIETLDDRLIEILKELEGSQEIRSDIPRPDSEGNI